MEQPETDVVASMDRAISVSFIKNSGGMAVRATRGQKSPAPGWDPRSNSIEKSNVLLETLANSADNLGVHLSGDLVDVDIDGENADAFLIPALDAFLPPCNHVWGRQSRKKTHRVYKIKSAIPFDPTNFPFLNRIKKINEIKVELRGGPASRAEYSLLPGSTHPSGEEYRWHDVAKAKTSPTIVSLDRVVEAVRMAGAATVLAPLWSEGVRQEMTLALAGFLHRVYTTTMSIDEGLFCLDYDGAVRFLDVLLDLSGDDQSDRRARHLGFKATWNKAEKGAAVTGATRIAEISGSKSLVSDLYMLLSENPDTGAIGEFTSRFVIWKGPAQVIDLEGVDAGRTKYTFSRPNFASSYGDKFVTIGDKRKLLPELLWSLSSSIRVHGVTFRPGAERLLEEPEGAMVNQWCGFKVPPASVEQTDSDVAPFLDYIENILASGNEEIKHWATAWLADIFQNPGDKCGTAMVLVGQEGAGKSILGSGIIGPIIGAAHYVATNSVDNIVRNFNASYANKLLIQCDEATNSRQKSMAARLKSFITDPVQQVEPKGVDPYHLPNHARLMFTSNDIDDAMGLASGNQDRRYAVFEVSNAKTRNIQDYWDPFVEWLGKDGTHAKIHKWLLQYKYDRKTIRRPPITAAKTNMQQYTMGSFDQWLASMVSRGHPLSEHTHTQPHHAFVDYNPNVIDRTGWPRWINTTTLLDDYRYHMRVNNFRDYNTQTESSLRKQLLKMGLTGTTSVRVSCILFDDRTNTTTTIRPRLYEAPGYRETISYLHEKYGYEVEEGDEPTEIKSNVEKVERF
jgi:hypothetical protein